MQRLYFTCNLRKKHHRFSGIDSGQRRKCIRVYRLLQGEGVMDRSALPVSACLTRRNGCAVPPSTMQKISCKVMSHQKQFRPRANDAEVLRRLAGCSRVRQRRGCRGRHGERRELEEHERGQWQLPRVDASQALRGKGA